MKNYVFGYLFVRIAKVFAIILLLCGMGVAVATYVQASLGARSLRYEPSNGLGRKILTLSREWTHTLNLVTGLLGGTPSSTISLEDLSRPSTSAQFEAVAKQFATIDAGRRDLKKALVSEFESAVLQIEEKLRAHAASLAGEDAPAKPRRAPSPAKAAPPETPAPPTVFSPLGRSQVAGRRHSITEARNFLWELKSKAENPENGQILAQAVSELAKLERLIPADLAASPNKTPEAAPTDSATPAREKLVAERVADQLAQVRALIQEALLTEWSIDDALAQANAELETERKKCMDAEWELKRMWLSAWVNIGLILAGSLAAAFLILVLSDVTRSFLDTATYSAIAASAYQQHQGTGE